MSLFIYYIVQEKKIEFKHKTNCPKRIRIDLSAALVSKDAKTVENNRSWYVFPSTNSNHKALN